MTITKNPINIITYDPMSPESRRVFVVLCSKSLDGNYFGDGGYLGGRVIDSVDVIAAPPEMTKNNQSFTDNVIYLDVTSGTDLGDYRWNVTFTMDTEEIENLVLVTPVQDIS